MFVFKKSDAYSIIFQKSGSANVYQLIVQVIQIDEWSRFIGILDKYILSNLMDNPD